MKRLLNQIPISDIDNSDFDSSRLKNDTERLTAKIMNFHVLLETMLESKKSFELAQDLVLEKNYEDAKTISDRLMEIILELPSKKM